MKKKAVKKIADALLPYLPGYVYRAQPNAIFQVPMGTVFRGMILDSSGFSAEAFYPHVFVYPLYIPADSLILSFGKRLLGNWKYEAGKEETLASDLFDAMEREGALKLLDDLSTPDNIARNLRRYHPNSNDPHFQRAIAYSELMRGRFEEGLRWLDSGRARLQEMQHTQPGVAWHAEFLGELSTLRDLAASDPHAAIEQLNAWTEYSRSKLYLPD